MGIYWASLLQNQAPKAFQELISEVSALSSLGIASTTFHVKNTPLNVPQHIKDIITVATSLYNVESPSKPVTGLARPGLAVINVVPPHTASLALAPGFHQSKKYTPEKREELLGVGYVRLKLAGATKEECDAAAAAAAAGVGDINLPS
ncbi:hypothetical protein M406DRAFT_105039 [Cryphonectria parasitica EP155]|uniref:Uncharacterized protein n=1 Tax=Cryphonectria parasitica (strain ATCC 38755 / EP155) TaxID=660469 RepID=A0A9P5CSK6_CRYP1|nr:uncharacterized protein M406DRAFT_105039 [Cryphonectria parasitica EP155]KAF3769699.1 hypothetical protein M406DRAFT_105039 [Cryphonectria parasitica EP155]